MFVYLYGNIVGLNENNQFRIFNRSPRIFTHLNEKSRDKIIFNTKKAKMENDKLEMFTLDQIKDEFIGERGTEKKEIYEQQLQLEVLGDLIKKVRLERKLTQQELGKLIGVQRAQISKLENNTTNVTMDTILRVFGALKAKVVFNVELMNQHVKIAG